MKVIDAHCHLEGADYPELDPVLRRAREAGVLHAVVVGQLQRDGTFGDALQLARRYPEFLSATMGIHPHDASLATEARRAEVVAACERPEVVAVGETGLDFYYDHSPREAQLEVFRWHCQLARTVAKPLVVHVRDAHHEALEVLKEENACEGMIHCFTGDIEAARAYLDLGFHLSISGIVTYKKSEPIQQAVRFAPEDRLLVETDSPYLAPVPHRGKKNEPAWVCEVARRVAELRASNAEDFAEVAAKNTARLLRLRVTGLS